MLLRAKALSVEWTVVFSLFSVFPRNGKFGHAVDKFSKSSLLLLVLSRMMYDSAFKKLREVIDTSKIKLADISSVTYETYKKHLIGNKNSNDNVAYNTARTYINYMNIIFNRAIKSGIYKKENPFIRLKRKDKLFIRTIPENEFELILNYLKETNLKLYRYIYFMKLTGFRLDEAIQLKWEQIHWDENVIDMITYKDSRHDLFPLNIEKGILKEFLLSFRKESGIIFNLNKDWVRVPFQKAIEKINEINKKDNKKWNDIKKYTIHDIRRTFGTKYAKLLMPIQLMKLMRHKDITTTLRYYVNMEVTDIADELNGK